MRCTLLSPGVIIKPQIDNSPLDTIQTDQNEPDYSDKRSATTLPQADLEMEGMGFGDILRKLMKNAPDISSAYSSNLGTDLKNLIPSSDATARPSFPGEKHAILKLPNGRPGIANYMGPGTNVIERLKRGDKGRTPADTVAKRHDIDYTLASGKSTKEEQLKAIRNADNRMVNSLKQISSGKHGGDSQLNIQTGLRLIQAKKIGEDLGVLSRSKFAGDLQTIPQADQVLLLNNQQELEQEGYGAELPGDALKSKLLKKMSRKNTIKNYSKGASYSKTYPDTKGYKLKQAVVGQGMIGFTELPQAMSGYGLFTEIASALKLNPDKRIMDTVKKIKNMDGKSAIPLLMMMKSKLLKKKHKKVLQQLIASAKKVGLHKMFDNQMSGTGKHPKRAKFLKDFSKGFKKSFAPFAKIVGPLLTAVGEPQFGIPLSIAGGVTGKL